MRRLLVVNSLTLTFGIIAAVLPHRAAATDARTFRAISGRVLQVGTTTPIPTVQVMVRGQRIGVPTDTHGRFALPDVPEGSVEIVLRHPCYFPVQVTMPAAGDAAIVIGLPFDQTSLKRAGCGGLGARNPDPSSTSVPE